MTLHRNIGTQHDPLTGGSPLRLECTAASLDLRFDGEIEYALFRLDRDSIVTPPVFVLSSASGEIVVTVATAGMFSVIMTGSHTGMWSGRDWHACRFRRGIGPDLDLFHGTVVSTTALSW